MLPARSAITPVAGASGSDQFPRFASARCTVADVLGTKGTHASPLTRASIGRVRNQEAGRRVAKDAGSEDVLRDATSDAAPIATAINGAKTSRRCTRGSNA